MNEEKDKDEFSLREYQSDILEVSIKQNTIIYLPTGAGKTYIAVMLIDRLSYNIIKPNNKISVLLVNTVALVEQHCTTIKRHTDFEVGQFTGDQNLDYWTKDQWLTQIEKYQVFIMTAQIFLDILRHGYLNLERVNLLIFDECHQAVNDQPMRLIMQLFQNISEAEQPRVLGLTATLLNGNCSPNKVEDVVRSLETTFHSRVATVQNLSQIDGFSTNPREKIVTFSSLNVSEVISKVFVILEHLKCFISEIKFNSQRRNSPRKLNQEKESKPLLRLINKLMLHIEMLGIYGGRKSTLSCLIEIERLKRQADDNFMDKIYSVITTSLTTILKIFEDEMACYEEVDQIMKFSTPQVLTLIEIFKTFKDNSETLCSIVFVKQRFTAKVLYYILKALSESDPNFSYIRTDFMVGFTAGSGERDTRESFYSAKINKKIVNNFRNNEINVLIASSVVEEGIDIPRCTVVIKFDRPMDYRSYIQSKGRARHGNSFYYIMVPDKEYNKYYESYNNFQMIEKILQKFLVGKTDGRRAPTELEIKTDLYDDHDCPPYYVNKELGADSPHVAATSAISLLNRYCQSLYYDKYVSLAPEWYSDIIENKFQITIELPILCPIRDPIKGPSMQNKIAAKRAAALQCCKLLHQAGELTDRLLPKTKLETELDFEYLFTHWMPEQTDHDENDEMNKSICKPGTKKFIRQYIIPVPKNVSLKSETYYLHPIVMKSDDTWEHLVENILLHTSSDYGLLTKTPMPNLCSFPIFVSAGRLEIEILENYTSLSLNSSEIADLKKFNHFIFFDVLNVLKNFLMYNNDETFFMIVVPLTNNNSRHSSTSIIPDFQIDMNTAQQNTKLETVMEPSIYEKMNLKVNDDLYLGKIINKWYIISDPYVVLEVCPSMNALSMWPNDNFETYEAYYKEKYGRRLYNPTLPLLYVKNISKRLNCIKPRSISLRAGNKRNKQSMLENVKEHLVPEMCILQKFSGTLWYKAHCLPTIIHRIQLLLNVEELRQNITKDTKIGFIEHAQQRKWSCMQIDFRILNSEEKKIQPVQQRNVMEVDAAAIMPSSNQIIVKKTNKDYAIKMLEKEYHWTDQEEPVDIERNIENITLYQIQDYEHFVSEKYSYADMEKIVNSPKTSKYPALTLEQKYEEKPIKMLFKEPTDFGPEQWVILQCLTANNADDIINLERLETLGDSLLKLSSTVFLYLKYPKCNEGILTNIKGKMVGNRNLLHCGIRKNLGGYMKVTEFLPKEWVPPTFCVPKLLKENIDSKELPLNKLYEFGIPADEQLKGELSEDTEEEFVQIIQDIKNDLELTSSKESTNFMNTYLGYQSVNDKTVADCVEALIGAYLQSNGLIGGLAIIEWFNIIPSNMNPKELFSQTPPSPIIYAHIIQENIDFHIPNYLKLEEHLGYTFKNRAFLLQALTHASYFTNRLTDCYQRLEFLGDAVLDFLITSHIFEISETLTPGQLTDLRSALVNNVTFAVLVVRNGLNKHLKCTNTKLMDAIDTFVKFQEEREFVINEETLFLVEEHPMYIAEHIHVPKVLGDLFESLAGAVFLDCGMDLQKTWHVFHRLMWREIETFRFNVPKSAVRLLNEYVSAAPRFEKATVVNHQVTLVSCSILVDGRKHEVHGFGENKKQAKTAAAKLALRLLSPD